MTNDQIPKTNQPNHPKGERSMDKNREKALNQTLSSLDKQFGKGAVMRLGADSHDDVPVIPSGALSLDLALGVGGYPRGRMIEIFGPESSGKTTLPLHAIAEGPKGGGGAALV